MLKYEDWGKELALAMVAPLALEAVFLTFLVIEVAIKLKSPTPTLQREVSITHKRVAALQQELVDDASSETSSVHKRDGNMSTFPFAGGDSKQHSVV